MAANPLTLTVDESLPAQWPPAQGEWTYDDYARLPDDGTRYEIIEGHLYMSPAPLTRHQRAVVTLTALFVNSLESQSLGQVYVAPTDVILSGHATAVQADLLFILQERLAFVREGWIEGAPDLIVEVLSPSNPLHDRRTKFHLYAYTGVREYWILDPDARTLDVYVLRGHAYALLVTFGPSDEARSELLPTLTFPTHTLFPA